MIKKKKRKQFNDNDGDEIYDDDVFLNDYCF